MNDDKTDHDHADIGCLVCARRAFSQAYKRQAIRQMVDENRARRDRLLAESLDESTQAEVQGRAEQLIPVAWAHRPRLAEVP